MLHVNIMSHVAAISLYRYSINYLIKGSFIFSSCRQVLKLFFQFSHSDTLSSQST